MTNLVSRMFQDKEVRFVGTADHPEWVAADIVAILYPEADSRNYSNHLSKVHPEWKVHYHDRTYSRPMPLYFVYGWML